MKKVRSFIPAVAAAITAGMAAAPASAVAATAYWSFQSTLAGEAGTATTTITENSGFAGTPAISHFAGTGNNAAAGTATGGVQYNAPVSGSTYAGTTIGTNSTTTGQSLSWATTATAGSSLTGASFTVTLDTTGLTDLRMDFDIRAATANASTPAPGQFSLLQYSLDGGSNWLTLTGVTSPTWAHLAGTSWEREIVDLSGVNAIENQSSVQLRFTFEDSAVATGAVNMNIRLDNLLITAVPEPGSTLLFGGFAAVSLLVRRRFR